MTHHETPPLGIPTVMVLADVDPSQMIRFYPANTLAKDLAEFRRVTFFTRADLEFIADRLKYRVVHTNGLPVAIPHPKGAYQRKIEMAPQHILDEA